MKNDKIFLDKSGVVLNVGDQVMYITDRRGINYGVIRSIERVKSYGYKHWKIKVFREKGGWNNESRLVVLTEPYVFKCGVELVYPNIIGVKS
jgi:hypothetical protein